MIEISNIKKNRIALLLILIIAIVLRFYQLGNNPPSLDWDEASLGYNAYSILKTGKDEYGVFLPLSIRSFGDYKPPLYTYVAIPSVVFFGLTEFAVRLPSVLFGLLAVALTYLLVKELLWKESESKGILSFLSAALLAISPWHLQFSRVAFEANIGLTLFIAGAWLFLKGLKNGKFLILSTIFFLLSLYAYHSPRLVVPVFVLGLALWFRKELWKQKVFVVISMVVGVFLILPLIAMLFAGGQARFKSVTTLTPQGTLDQSIRLLETDKKNTNYLGVVFHNRRIVYALTAVKGYLDHFDLRFLFLTGDGPARHHAAGMGVLYQIEAPFVLLGIVLLIKRRKYWSIPVFWWFITAPLASSITSGTPHAVRSLLYLPTYQIFTTYGVYNTYLWFKKKQNRNSKVAILIKSTSYIVVLFFSANILYYLHMYYVHSFVEHARDWQYGYKEVVKITNKYIDDVDRVIITYAYDQPYVYFLFYKPIEPNWYQEHWESGEIQRAQRQFGKYVFRAIEWENDKNLSNSLLVGTPGEIPEGAPGKIADVAFPDGTIAFRIVRR